MTVKEKIIRYDLEQHFAPAEFYKFLQSRTQAPMIDGNGVKHERRDLNFSFPLDIPFLGTPFTARQMLTDMGEGRIRQMDEAGIDVAFLSHTTGFYTIPKEDCIYWAKVHNDSVADYASRFPDRIRPTMTLPVMYVQDALTEMQRCCDMGFRLWFIESNFGPDFPRIYDDMYLPLLQKANDSGIAIYLHPGIPTEPTLLDNGLLYAEPALGFGQDVMKTLVRLILKGTFDRLPHLRVIIGHYGEFLPFIMDTIDKELNNCKEQLYANRHTVDYYVRHHNIMFTSSGNQDPQVYEFTRKRVGISNLMFGADYPYERYKDSVDIIDAMNLPECDKKIFWQDNVERFILSDTPDWTDVIPEESAPSAQVGDSAMHDCGFISNQAEIQGESIYIRPCTPVDDDFHDFGDAYGTGILGYTEYVMRTATRIILDGTLDRDEDLTLIIPFKWQYFPFVLTRMDNRFFHFYPTPEPHCKCRKEFKQYFREGRILFAIDGTESPAAIELAKEVIL